MKFHIYMDKPPTLRPPPSSLFDAGEAMAKAAPAATTTPCCFPDCRQPVEEMQSHSAQPCFDGRCCAQCNTQRVIPSRLEDAMRRDLEDAMRRET